MKLSSISLVIENRNNVCYIEVKKLIIKGRIKMEVILHIGNHKTGSTTIQNLLYNNRSLLFENSIYYGEFLEKQNANNHINLVCALLKEALVYYNVLDNYKNFPNIDFSAKQIIYKMFQNSKDCNKIVISNESFFCEAYRLLVGLKNSFDINLQVKINKYIKQKLFDILSEFNCKIKIICYLRRQDLYIESQYNQYCKIPWNDGENLVSFNEFLGYNPCSLNYEKDLNDWSMIFGKENLVIKSYEKEQLKDGIIKDFFVDILNLNQDILNKFKVLNIKDNNIRLSRDALEVKRKMNISNPKLNTLFIEYSLNHKNEEDYAYFTVDDRIKFMKKYEIINQNIAINYLNRKELFYNNDYNIEEYKGLSTEKMAEIFEWIFNRLNC